MSFVPQSLTGSQIRQKFLEFYSQKEHHILPSSSLVPEDPTVLLTIAGMLPFKPIFLGQRSPEFPRVTTSQKCIRTNDIENVGVTKRHHTFFEMLGNFSFGDYFKSQAIAWGWEISTQIFALPKERLVVSVFEEDDESYAIWRDQIGVSPQRIIRMGSDDNFWTSGVTGPCGPCSEIYFDFHPELGDDNINLEDDTRFIEFYNLVFMQYNRDSDGNLTPLQSQNIDTGMGLERMAQILQQSPNNYETDLIFPIIKTASEIANIDYHNADEKVKTSLKVIGDHTRAIMHMISDQIRSSNIGRGYILRRLIRRVVRHGKLIGIKGDFTTQVVETAITLAEDYFPEVRQREKLIKAELQREESQFTKTLERGEKLLLELITKVKNQGKNQIDAQDAFTLYDTYGFPVELTQEIAAEYDLIVDIDGFNLAMEAQIKMSQSAHETIDLTVQGSLDKLADHIHPTKFLGYEQLTSNSQIMALLSNGKIVDEADEGSFVQVVLNQTPFYAESGGQIGDQGVLSANNILVEINDVQKESDFFVHYGKIISGTLRVGDEIISKVDSVRRKRTQANHSATHLLQSALKLIVDDTIAQAGSLVGFDRLRFDFNSPRSVTNAEIQQIEDKINSWITESHPAEISILPINEAKQKGAIAMFGEKYGSEVRVLDFPGVSMELCGGTHVNNTSEIGVFKIISESGVASGIRRIEAMAGGAVLDYLNIRDKVVKELSDRFAAKPEELPERINTLQQELKTAQKELEKVKGQLAIAKSDQLLTEVENVGELKILVAELENVDPESLKIAAQRLLQKLGEGAVILASIPQEQKVNFVAVFSHEVNKKGLKAGQFIGKIAKICGGGGGGKPNLAEAGGRDPSQLKLALETAKTDLKSGLL